MGASAEHPPSEHWAGGSLCILSHLCEGHLRLWKGTPRPPMGKAVFGVMRDLSAPQGQLCSGDWKEPCSLSPAMARPTCAGTPCLMSGVRTRLPERAPLPFNLSVVSDHLLRESHQEPGSSLLWGGDRNTSVFQLHLGPGRSGMWEDTERLGPWTSNASRTSKH